MRELIIVIVLWCVSGLGVAAVPATDDWIDGLAGGWLGEDNVTPLGGMDFAMLFEWKPDGSLASHSALNRETWIDLRFRKAEDGRWLLEESGGMEGLGVQAHTLEPVEAPGEIRRWLSADDPGIIVDLSRDGTTLVMDVRLRGEDHARFELRRVPDSAIPGMRKAFEEAASRSPDEVSIHEVTGASAVPDTIRSARAAVAADPRSAQAHLRLAQVIGERLQADPMGEGPRFAGEMLKSLRTAIDLDPSMTEAYHWLVGYYLNAPPIAGGSVEQAEKTARKLAEADPDAGKQLLALVEQAKNGRAATQ